MPELGVLPPRYWRNVKYYYRLEAAKCRKCGRIYYPPRLRCNCGSTDLERIWLIEGLRFVLEKYTVLHSVPVDFEKIKPLGFGLVRVEFQEGQMVRILAPLTDFISSEELERSIGADLEPVFRVVMRDKTYGLICYGTKFRSRASTT